MKMDDRHTIIIGKYASRCKACGGNAHPDDTSHNLGGPLLLPNMGCGIPFFTKVLGDVDPHEVRS